MTLERVRGALLGCALGDAMGMPTEMMARPDVAEQFPDGVMGFCASTDRDVFGRDMRAGEVTDDTINTLLVAQMLVEDDGAVNARRFIDYLIAWIDANPEKSCGIFGSNTLKALDAIRRGTPIERSGIFGTTNGGAMKITPIGVVRDYRDMDALVDAVEQICMPTHNTSAAIACASAVAAGVSYAVRGGDDIDGLWDVGIGAATIGWGRGYAFPTADVVWRMKLVRSEFSCGDAVQVVERLQDIYGTGVESVETAPAVFAVVALADGNPLEASRIAASIGGDTDTIGALATAICGAMHPELIPSGMADRLESVNDFGLDVLAAQLLQLVVR